MSISRTDEAKKIIAERLGGGTECITGEEPEKNGIYVVTAQAATYQRAFEIRADVAVALASAGFGVVSDPPETFFDTTGDEKVTRASLKFRVAVGGARTMDLGI